MSETVEAFAVLVGIPALIGFVLPRWFRRRVGIAAAIAAVVLWLRGVNVHGPSVWLFFFSGGVALGALLRECAALLVRLIRRPARGPVEGAPRHG